MARAGLWALGLVGSAALHVAGAGFYLATQSLDHPPRQTSAKSRLALDTVSPPTQSATAQTPQGDDAQSAQPIGSALDAGAVPQSRANELAPDGQTAAPLQATGTTAQVAQSSGQTLNEASAEAETLPTANTAVQTAAPVRPSTETVAATPTETQTLTAQVEAVPSLNAQPPTGLTASPQTLETAPTAAQNLIADTAIAKIPNAVTMTASAQTDAVSSLNAQLPTASIALPQAVEKAPTPAQSLTADAATVQTPTGARMTASAQTAATLPASAPAPQTLATSTITPQSVTAALPSASIAPTAAIESVQTAALATPDRPTPLSNTSGTPAASTAAPGIPAAQAPLPATKSTAQLAWAFGDRLVTDPASLNAIQAFMEPDALPDAAAVRDDLSNALTGTDCARLSATFLPESGVLEMRGHIPDPALQPQILATLKEQVGEGIPVRANLLHLPKPQCGALTGIADVGLPQSTDQFTNTRLIGATAHARAYNYSEGQRLEFDLTAPDYDAFVYVDYFNASGEVIHLVPNETIALERSAAESLFGVGQDRAGKPSLRITIGPPYGQEIAVAFAASEPLYDGLRPIVEPAEDYLAWLKQRVADTRAANPDFKGEWVYFFITTSAATQ